MGALVSVALKTPLATSLASPVCWAVVGSGIGIGIGVGLARVWQQAHKHKSSGSPMSNEKTRAITASSVILETSGRAGYKACLCFCIDVFLGPVKLRPPGNSRSQRIK